MLIMHCYWQKRWLKGRSKKKRFNNPIVSNTKKEEYSKINIEGAKNNIPIDIAEDVVTSILEKLKDFEKIKDF